MNKVSELLKHEEALKNSIQYWVEHWDWECQTLFGLDIEDFQTILDNWPNGFKLKEENTIYALQGSFRELLYGASAIRTNEIPEVLGVNESIANELAEILTKEIKENEV
jgi:uncharacterized protein YecA (UPF0149 family)